MDAFFAAVEQRDNPELRGKPVVIGSLPGTRGVVCTCSYEARKYGVRSAMAINEAALRLPHDAIYILPNSAKYAAVSSQIMEIFSTYSPSIEQVSVDEAFLDMTGSRRLMGDPLTIAQKLSSEIISSLGLTASMGIAPNKFLAKLASDENKPCGITMTPFDPTEISHWLEPFPVGRLWGVGAVMQKQLALLGVHTVRDLQQLPESLILSKFGASGRRLSQIRFGIDERSVAQTEGEKSISREHTFNEDESSHEAWIEILRWICDDVTSRARKSSVRGRTITLSYRTPDFQRHSSSKTIANSTDCSEEMFQVICGLVKKSLSGIGELRLIGARLSGFNDSGVEQLNLLGLPEIAETGKNWQQYDQLRDLIGERFGTSAIARGTATKTKSERKNEVQNHNRQK